MWANPYHLGRISARCTCLNHPDLQAESPGPSTFQKSDTTLRPPASSFVISAAVVLGYIHPYCRANRVVLAGPGYSNGMRI